MRRRALSAALLVGALLVPAGGWSAAADPAEPPPVQQLSETVPRYDPMAGLRMGIAGLFERGVPGFDRTAKVYVPEGAVLGASMVVLTVPAGQDTVEWLTASGWLGLSDEERFLLYVLEPGDGGWGSAAEEQGYVDAAYAAIAENGPDGRGTWYLPPESYYVVGYDAAGAALQKAVMRDPTLVAAAAFVDASDVDGAYLASLGETAYPTPDSAGEPITAAEVPMPVWIVESERSPASDAVVAYWKQANQTRATGTAFRGGRIFVQQPDTLDGYVAESSSTAVAVTDSRDARAEALSGSRALYDGFLSRWTRYGGAVGGNTIGFRPDLEALGVEHTTVELDGRLREYLVYTPPLARAAAADGRTVPLVMALHGFNMTMYSMFDFSRWWEVADREGFVLVMPTARNVDNTTPWDLAADGIDMPFIELVLDDMVTHYPVDTDRIYLGGQSMGSMMTQAIGRNPALSPRFTALGSTSGAGTSADRTGETLPFFMLFGEFDFWPWDPATPTVGDSLAYWIDRNDALGSPTSPASTEWVGRYDLYHWTGADGVETVRYGVTRGRGHSIVPDEMNLLWDWYRLWRKAPDGSNVRADAPAATVYSVPFDDALLVREPGAATVTRLTYDAWAALGFPAPVPAPTRLLSVSWDPTVFAVSSVDGLAWWDAVTYPQWAAVGFPAPDRGASVGAALSVVRHPTSTELFAVVPDLMRHKLTPAEWAGLGSPAPQDADTGFLRLSWAPEGIAEVDLDAGTPAERLDYARWSSLGFPTPADVPMLPGDVVCFVPGSDRLAYDGATFDDLLTYEQWRATGFATPAVC